MQKFDSSTELHIIVVDNFGDELINSTVSLLNDYEVKFVLCEDVYSTVAELAKTKSPDVLTIGRLEQLNKEQGRFFHIAGENNYICCCLTDKNSAQKQISAAKEAGALIVNKLPQIEELLAKLLTGGSASLVRKNGGSSSSSFNKDEFTVTKSELDALFEG